MALETQQGPLGFGTNTHAQQPMKFSRYRSVRQAASNVQQQVHPSTHPLPSPDVPAAPPPSATIAKSMSRYRRAKPAAAIPPVPGSVDRARTADNGGSSRREPDRDIEGREMASTELGTATAVRDGGDGKQMSRIKEKESDEAAREKHRQDAMARLTGGDEKPAKSGSSSKRPTTRGQDARKESQEKGKAHLQKKDTHAKPDRLSFKEKLGLSRPKGSEETKSEAKYIEVGGGGIVPGIDAPVSAVNAGERRVRVQYRDLSINLPLTPSTRVQDLLFSAANCLGCDIDPKVFMLMESFTELSLERPLRKYEHVRDVMNSWAHDGENALLVVPPSSSESLSQLGDGGVPSEQPEDATFYLYHSQRPRKWDKRFVTLRADGQMTVSKKEGAPEQTNICHLSDFDIYSPEARYLSKKIKPPKKFCYAVKSQQKSSMFLTTENFVHFFATNDKGLADSFHKAVQRWRSWYLVNKLGAGQKKDTEDSQAKTSAVPQGPRHPKDISESTPYQLGTFKPLLNLDSLDHYSEDEESPLPASAGTDLAKSSSSKEIFARRKSTRGRALPPSAFPKKLTVDTDMATSPTGNGTLLKGMSAEDMEAETFAPSGLLGRTYSHRQRAMREREERERKANQLGSPEPFSPQGLISGVSSVTSPTSSHYQHHQYGHSNSHPNSRTNTMRSAQAPPDGFVKRSNSVQKPKPLVDLTPVYQEPPQYRGKGRGVTVEPGVPLVEAATGIELAPGAIEIPPATTWRRPAAYTQQQQSQEPASEARITRNRSNTNQSAQNHARQHHHHHHHTTTTSPNSPTASIHSPEGPFAPNSLLARSTSKPVPSQRVATGHGVATGDRNAAKPMLDLSSDNPFAEGSLLRDLHETNIN